MFRGRGFESLDHIQYGHFSYLFVVKKTKINEKEAVMTHFKKLALY